MSEQYDVYSKFDLEQHKKNFIDYCEVVILPNGEIEYAVPSHQEKLIKIMGKPRQEVMDMIPESYYYDVLTWLLQQTGCVSVWSDFYKGEPTTEVQQSALNTLLENNLTR